MPLSINPITGQFDLVGSSTGGGSGDVIGPASSTDNAISRFDGTTGKLIQDSLVVIDDSGTILAPDGTALLPSYGFSSEAGTDTGMYRTGVGTIGWSSQGNLAMELFPGGDLTIQGNISADNYPPTSTANTFSGFDGTGVLFSVPGFYIDTTSGGMGVGLTEQPNNLGGAQVHTTNVSFDPLQNSPNESWNIYNIQAQFDINSSGFNQGTNGTAAVLMNLGYNHQGTGSVGTLSYHNLTANIGNGTDPISIKGMSLVGSGIGFAANTTIDGFVQGYNFNISVNSGAFSTSNLGVQAFSDTANFQVPVYGWNSASLNPSILSIANNSGYSGVSINPTITTFTGNASMTGVGVGGTMTTFGSNGGFVGLNVNPTVTTMGSSGYWHGLDIYGLITTSHNNVQGINISTTINGGDASYTAIGINPQGTAVLPQVQGLSINLDSLASTAQKTAINSSGGRASISSPYHTDILPPSPGFADLNSVGGEFWVKPGFPVASTLVFGLNAGQSVIFEDDMGPDGFGGILGYCAHGLIAQGGVASTKTVAKVTGSVFAFSVADLTPLSITDGGTITESSMIVVGGYLSSGGTVNVGDLYGVNILSSFGTFATNSWGFFNDSDTENYLAKSLALGTTTKKVTNNDIAIEVGTDKAIRFAVMTEATRDGLSAVEGMTIFNTDSNLLEYYDGTAWVCGCGENVDGGTAGSVYGGTTAIDGGAA